MTTKREHLNETARQIRKNAKEPMSWPQALSRAAALIKTEEEISVSAKKAETTEAQKRDVVEMAREALAHAAGLIEEEATYLDAPTAEKVVIGQTTYGEPVDGDLAALWAVNAAGRPVNCCVMSAVRWTLAGAVTRALYVLTWDTPPEEARAMEQTAMRALCRAVGVDPGDNECAAFIAWELAKRPTHADALTALAAASRRLSIEFRAGEMIAEAHDRGESLSVAEARTAALADFNL